MEAAVRDRQEIAEGITVPEARLHRMRTFRVADVVVVIVVVLVADKYRRRILPLGRNACNYVSVVRRGCDPKKAGGTDLFYGWRTAPEMDIPETEARE